MTPIQDLLHRIRWDREFGDAQFVIGYRDRFEEGLIEVPFREIRFPSGEHFAFEALGEDGAVHAVPLHRVRKVWRNGVLVWDRDAPAEP
jgi:uncharacterized protein (UPF0248 family)